MTSAGTLFPGNANTIKRYCIASYDEAATRVAEQGAVIPARMARHNTTRGSPS